MVECGEKKDQDRAVWFPQSQTAADSDGTSSSPDSHISAQTLTDFAPAIYTGKPGSNLKAICDLLQAMRAEKMACKINLPPNTPESMKEILIESARQKLQDSFQATFVSVQLESNGSTVIMKAFRCGDSPLFVFSPEGKLIASSPLMEQCTSDDDNKAIIFNPGDELLVKAECDLSDYHDILNNVSISKEYRSNWLVCVPVDKCKEGGNDYAEGLKIGSNDKLIVPKYLAGHAINIGNSGYVSIPFSQTLRLLTDKKKAIDKSKFHSGSVTHVLPDHFYTGHWVYLEDEFPADTQFLIASDGFTECFKSPTAMWQWLNRNKKYFSNERHKHLLLKRLHFIRQQKIGDDDISFVWMFPKENEATNG